MKRSRILKILFLFLVLAYGTSIMAQQPTPGPAGAYQKSYEQIQQQLKFLREVARQYPNDKLDELINKIEFHLQNAKRAQQLGFNRRATQELKSAQQLTRLAMKMVMTGPMAQMREKLNEQIRRAEEAIHRNFNPEAQRLLQKAKQTRMQAERAFKNRNVQKAAELYRVALFQANKAYQLATAAGGPNMMALYNEEKANFEDLRRRAQTLLQSQPQATGMTRELFNQALQQRKRAELAFAKGQVQQAVELYRWATRLMIRVIDMMGSGEANWMQRAREELQRTRELFRSVEGVVAASGNQQLGQMFDQAKRVLLDAENSFARKDYPQTVKKAELARRILNRLSKYQTASPVALKARMLQERETLRNLLRQLESEIDQNKHPAAARLLEQARYYLRQSDKAFRNGRPELGAAMLFAATRLAGSARELALRVDAKNQQQEQLSQQFARFEQAIKEIRGNKSVTANEVAQAWLKLAEDLFQMASEAKKNGQLNLMDEYSRLGLQVIQRIQMYLQKG